jgi:hypothetical protein
MQMTPPPPSHGDIAEADADLATVLAQFTNLIMNERVRAYNEGLDNERDRCATIAEEFCRQGRDGYQIAQAIRDGETPSGYCSERGLTHD